LRRLVHLVERASEAVIGLAGAVSLVGVLRVLLSRLPGLLARLALRLAGTIDLPGEVVDAGLGLPQLVEQRAGVVGVVAEGRGQVPLQALRLGRQRGPG